GGARLAPQLFDPDQIGGRVAPHDPHGRRADDVAGDADLVGRGRRQPERAGPRSRAPGRLVREEANRGNGDHVDARDCLSAAARKCRMYCAPEYSETTVESQSSLVPALWYGTG